MVIALWIVNVILALFFLVAGANKLAKSKDALATAGMAYVEDFSAPAIKGIGAIEVVGALGLVLPLATGIAPVLAPLAAVGLAIVMVGATVVHARRSEPFVPTIAFAAAAIASAVLGFLVVL